MKSHRNRHHLIGTHLRPARSADSLATPDRRVYPVGHGTAESNEIRSMLVPLDGSRVAEHAIPHALAIARRTGAAVRLVHVYSRLDHEEPWQMYVGHQTNERRREAKSEYLRELAARIARRNAVAMETIVAEGIDTEEALLRAAAGVDLVVMASRRRGFLGRMCFRSVAEGLRKRLPVPMLLVRGYSSPVDLTGDPIAHRIVVPLDGSSVAERILDPVTAIRRLEGAEVKFVNVQNESWNLGTFEHTSPTAYLRGLVERFETTDRKVGAAVVTTDDRVAGAVEEFARRHDADLIALAGRADGPFSRLLRGSVVDALVRRSDLPILLTRAEVGAARPAFVSVA